MKPARCSPCTPRQPHGRSSMSALQNHDAGGFDAILGTSPEIGNSSSVRRAAWRWSTHRCSSPARPAMAKSSPRPRLPPAAAQPALLRPQLRGCRKPRASSSAATPPVTFTGGLWRRQTRGCWARRRQHGVLDEIGEMSLPAGRCCAFERRQLPPGRYMAGAHERAHHQRHHRSLEAMAENPPFSRGCCSASTCSTCRCRRWSSPAPCLAHAFLSPAPASNQEPMRVPGACAAMLDNPWAGNVRQLPERDLPRHHRRPSGIIQTRPGARPGHHPASAGEVLSLEQAVAISRRNCCSGSLGNCPSSRRPQSAAGDLPPPSPPAAALAGSTRGLAGRTTRKRYSGGQSSTTPQVEIIQTADPVSITISCYHPPLLFTAEQTPRPEQQADPPTRTGPNHAAELISSTSVPTPLPTSMGPSLTLEHSPAFLTPSPPVEKRISSRWATKSVSTLPANRHGCQAEPAGPTRELRLPRMKSDLARLHLLRPRILRDQRCWPDGNTQTALGSDVMVATSDGYAYSEIFGKPPALKNSSKPH